MTRATQDPDELLTRIRRAHSDAQRQVSGGDWGPAMAQIQGAWKLFEDLDAYLQMGGRLPSSWKRARPAGASRPVDQSTAARCGARLPGATEGTWNVCDRLRGHDGPHKHLPSGFTWR